MGLNRKIMSVVSPRSGAEVTLGQFYYPESGLNDPAVVVPDATVGVGAVHQ